MQERKSNWKLKIEKLASRSFNNDVDFSLNENVDTNVVIDYLAKRQPFAEDANPSENTSRDS